jgi:hypothetical protein
MQYEKYERLLLRKNDDPNESSFKQTPSFVYSTKK